MFAIKSDAPIPLTGSPSLQFSNLTSSESGRVAYIRSGEVCIADLKGENVKLPIQRSTIYQVSFETIDNVEVLVIAASSGIQVWSKTGTSMLFFFASSSIAEMDEDKESFFRGISSTGVFLCVGTSFGKLVIFGPSSGSKSSFDGSDLSLISVVACTSEPILSCAGSSSLIAGGSDSGEIKCFYPQAGFEIKYHHAGYGSPVTAMVTRGEVLIAGYASGHLRVFRTDIQEMTIEINAHARPISGMCLHHKHPYFVTCSEDQTLMVWDFPDFSNRACSDINIIFSDKLANRILTGVAFLSKSRICTVSYDDDTMVVYKKQ